MKISERGWLFHFTASNKYGVDYMLTGQQAIWIAEHRKSAINESFQTSKGKVGIISMRKLTSECTCLCTFKVHSEVSFSSIIPPKKCIPLAIAVGFPWGLFFPAVNFLFHREETFLYFYRF